MNAAGISLSFVLMIAAAAYPATIDELEQRVAAEMRVMIELRKEIRHARSEAEELERKVAEIKRSRNVIDRVLLGRQLEKLHRALAEIDRKEEQLRTKKKQVNEIHAEAMNLLADRQDAQASKLREHFELITFRRIEHVTRLMKEVRKEHAAADEEKREVLQKKFEELKTERQQLLQAFLSYYGLDAE